MVFIVADKASSNFDSLKGVLKKQFVHLLQHAQYFCQRFPRKLAEFDICTLFYKRHCQTKVTKVRWYALSGEKLHWRRISSLERLTCLGKYKDKLVPFSPPLQNGDISTIVGVFYLSSTRTQQTSNLKTSKRYHIWTNQYPLDNWNCAADSHTILSGYSVPR